MTLQSVDPMADEITFDDLAKLLREHDEELKSALHLPEAQFMIPTDGRGLRVQVASPDENWVAPKDVLVTLPNGSTVLVPLEDSPMGFQEYRAL